MPGLCHGLRPVLRVLRAGAHSPRVHYVVGAAHPHPQRKCTTSSLWVLMHRRTDAYNIVLEAVVAGSVLQVEVEVYPSSWWCLPSVLHQGAG